MTDAAPWGVVFNLLVSPDGTQRKFLARMVPYGMEQTVKPNEGLPICELWFPIEHPSQKVIDDLWPKFQALVNDMLTQIEQEHRTKPS